MAETRAPRIFSILLTHSDNIRRHKKRAISRTLGQEIVLKEFSPRLLSFITPNRLREKPPKAAPPTTSPRSSTGARGHRCFGWVEKKGRLPFHGTAAFRHRDYAVRFYSPSSFDKRTIAFAKICVIFLRDSRVTYSFARCAVSSSPGKTGPKDTELGKYRQ